MYPVFIIKITRMGIGTVLGPVWGWELLCALLGGMGPRAGASDLPSPEHYHQYDGTHRTEQGT